jgi:hypothetical protein
MKNMTANAATASVIPTAATILPGMVRVERVAQLVAAFDRELLAHLLDDASLAVVTGRAARHQGF